MNALEPKSGRIDAVTFNTRPCPGLNSAVSICAMGREACLIWLLQDEHGVQCSAHRVLPLLFHGQDIPLPN